jgi:DNA invertase Pin-like site-specific DNA recombinase
VTATPAPAEGELLAATPLAGYGRVSTREQNIARQQAALSTPAARNASSTRRRASRSTPPWREFVRTIIVANTNEGLAAARARGQCLARPTQLAALPADTRPMPSVEPYDRLLT